MQLISKTLTQSDGQQQITRDYSVHIPTQGAQGRPLIILCHGHGGSGPAFAGLPGMEYALADKGYVLAFPTALVGPDNNTNWITLATPGTQYPELDQNFMELIVDALTTEYGIDASKVYMGGFSQGTDVCWQMYTQRADLVKGCCTAGRGIHDAFQGLTPSEPRPWLTCIGEQDDSWNGSVDVLGAVATQEYVCGLNNRTTTATPPTGTAAGNPPNPTTGTKLWVYDYQTPNGSPTAPVGAGRVQKKTVNAGHRWFAPVHGDNFLMSGLLRQFFVDKAGLPAPL